MNGMDYFAKCMDQYADFKGRATRSEYWWFTLFNVLIHVVVSATAGAIGDEALLAISNIVFFLVLFIPQLAVSVRRLHDTGKSGWFMFFSIFPPTGIVLLIFLLLRTTPVTNRFGPPPAPYRDVNEPEDDLDEDEEEFLEDFGRRTVPIRGKDRRY